MNFNNKQIKKLKIWNKNQIIIFKMMNKTIKIINSIWIIL